MQNIILINLLLLVIASAVKFAVIQSNHKHILLREPIQQLRSYHPHYLHSYSYPEPVTPHIYYGEVVHNRPRFYVKDNINSSQKIQNIIVVNNQQEDGIYQQNQKKKVGQSIYKYILSIQFENLLDQDINYTIEVHKAENFYAIGIQYLKKIKTYLLYFTYQDLRVLPLSSDKLLGIKHRLRNIAANNPKQSWMLYQNIQWNGTDNVDINHQHKFKGIIFQIQYTNPKLLNTVKIQLKEIYEHYKGQTMQQIIQRLLKVKPDNLFFNDKTITKKQKTCAEDAIRKVKAGLSYQYGKLQIVKGGLPVQNSPNQLLSFSPSRTRFPWGFLWDDGFHCQVVMRNQPKLALKVIKSWLDTIMLDGWIPRQQNRGAQRQFLCSCPRFMKKDIRDGNPPTLILGLQYLLRKGGLNKANFGNYWKKIKLWYQWFIKTQQSQTQKYIFAWHDSIINNGSFNSGMDDFPRLLNTKGHVDMQSWMFFFTQFMTLASQEFQPQSAFNYQEILKQIKGKITEFNDPKDYIYKDIGSSGFNQYLGYPSILPLAFGTIDYHSKQYNATIQLIKDKLDTGSGISSITMDSPLYLQNKDAYWRGPVWININYLILRGLKLYYPLQQQLYSKIRRDLLKTVCGNWKTTGFFYQNYIKGQGSFSYPFNGWTSLIAIIDSQQY